MSPEAMEERDRQIRAIESEFPRWEAWQGSSTACGMPG